VEQRIKVGDGASRLVGCSDRFVGDVEGFLHRDHRFGLRLYSRKLQRRVSSNA
jgi:hypothetical protein